MIRSFSANDVQSVAELHSEALSGDFLSNLGVPFLKKLYHCILVLDVGFGIVYEADNHVVAAAIAVYDFRRFYRDLLKKCSLSLITALLKPLLTNPLLLRHVIETLLSSATNINDSSVKTELLLLAVRNKYQRQGIGKNIVKAFNKELAKRGINDYIVRIYSDNIRGNTFYRKMNYKLHYSFTMYKRNWNLYHYRINEG